LLVWNDWGGGKTEVVGGRERIRVENLGGRSRNGGKERHHKEKTKVHLQKKTVPKRKEKPEGDGKLFEIGGQGHWGKANPGWTQKTQIVKRSLNRGSDT